MLFPRIVTQSDHTVWHDSLNNFLSINNQHLMNFLVIVWSGFPVTTEVSEMVDIEEFTAFSQLTDTNLLDIPQRCE